MAEVLDREKQGAGAPEPAETQETPQPQETADASKASAFSEAPGAPKKKKKNKKRIVRRIITLVILAALAGGGIFAWKTFGGDKDEGQTELLTEVVSRGSITSIVEGSGAAVAKDSASVTLLSAGQVREVFVSEGDYVTAGTLLFNVDSKEAQEAFDNARERVRKAEQSLGEQERALEKYLGKAVSGDVKAEFSGILIDVGDKKKQIGREVSENETFATIADNTTMLLPLYFSYAYDGEIAVGQSATVSVPVTMAQLSGTVHEIHRVEYITDEGGRMFEVVIAVENPGTLTKDMEATATVNTSRETVYPYQSGKLDYFRTAELTAPLTGKLISFEAYKWQKLNAGESIAHIEKDQENREDELKTLNDNIENARRSLEDAQKTLDKEQKNLDSLSATAPIDGTVLSLGIHPGDETKAGVVAVSIADTSTMKIEATVDEMYVSYVKAGMPIDLNLWGDTELTGTIESVSLSAKSENGVARFPMVITVDNSEGLLMSGAYVNYKFTASQSDDCLLVPIQCVKSAQTTDGENCKVVFVQSDVPPENMAELSVNADVGEGFYPVIVEVGISDNHNVEILSGVEEDTVVYAGVMSSDSGMGMFF